MPDWQNVTVPIQSYLESIFLLFVCDNVCSPGFNTKEGIAEDTLSSATFFLSPLHLLTSYFLTIFSPFLSLLSALPFLLIKIYSHNLLLLSSKSERLDWQFHQQNHSSGEEMDAANLRAPCRYHGNISTRGARAERGGRGERREKI